MACYPDSNGANCNTGPELFCGPNLHLVCRPGLPEVAANCTCRLEPPQPFMCEARVMWNRDMPSSVSIAQDASCPGQGLDIALSVILAKILMGTVPRP